MDTDPWCRKWQRWTVRRRRGRSPRGRGGARGRGCQGSQPRLRSWRRRLGLPRQREGLPGLYSAGGRLKINTHSFSMLKCYQHITGIRTHHAYHTKCTFWTFEHFVQGHGVYFLEEWNVKTVTLYGYFLNCIVCTLNDPDLTQGDTNPHKEICIVGH